MGTKIGSECRLGKGQAHLNEHTQPKLKGGGVGGGLPFVKRKKRNFCNLGIWVSLVVAEPKDLRRQTEHTHSMSEGVCHRALCYGAWRKYTHTKLYFFLCFSAIWEYCGRTCQFAFWHLKSFVQTPSLSHITYSSMSMELDCTAWLTAAAGSMIRPQF